MLKNPLHVFFLLLLHIISDCLGYTALWIVINILVTRSINFYITLVQELLYIPYYWCYRCVHLFLLIVYLSSSPIIYFGAVKYWHIFSTFLQYVCPNCSFVCSSCLFIGTGFPRVFPLHIKHHTHFCCHNSNKLSLVHLTISIKVVSFLLFWQANYRHSRCGWFFSMSLNWYLLVFSVTDIIV